jgi:hypothetical protein
MLERIGPATIAEISTLAKMMKHGENIRPYLNEFEQRVKRTEVREAGLEREREEREREEPRGVVAVVRNPTPPLPKQREEPAVAAPLLSPVEEVRREAPPPPPPPKPAVPLAAAAKPARPIGQGEFAYFRQRMAELAKKYPAPK